MKGYEVFIVAVFDHSADLAAAAGIFVVFGTIVLVGVAISIILHWRIAAKAGYPGAYSLLMLIPLVNIVVYFMFAFSEWPIERALRGGGPGPSSNSTPPPKPSYVPPGGGGYAPQPYFPPPATPPAIPPEA